jgi:CheY-like chemotaxis protein
VPGGSLRNILSEFSGYFMRIERASALPLNVRARRPNPLVRVLAQSYSNAVAPAGAPAPVAVIVDDSLTIRMDLAAAFEAAGFVVRLCATAVEARAAVGTAASVVVLDVLLPDADGVELLRELRADPATAALPILMLSIEAEVEHRIRGMQTGAAPSSAAATRSSRPPAVRTGCASPRCIAPRR